jgi:hypothetical protein
MSSSKKPVLRGIASIAAMLKHVTQFRGVS